MRTLLPRETDREEAALCLSLDRRQFMQFLGGGIIVYFLEQASEEVIPWREIV